MEKADDRGIVISVVRYDDVFSRCHMLIDRH